MADTHDSKAVVVTGDVTMDWNLARTRRDRLRARWRQQVKPFGKTINGR